MTFQFDATQYQPMEIGEPMPKDWYYAVTETPEFRPTKSGTGEMITIPFRIEEAPYNGRKIFHNFNTKNTNQQAQDMGFGQLTSFARAINVLFITNGDLSVWANQAVRIKVGIQKETDEYDARNIITAFRNINDPIPAKKNAAPQVMGAPQVGMPQQSMPAGFGMPAAPQPMPGTGFQPQPVNQPPQMPQQQQYQGQQMGHIPGTMAPQMNPAMQQGMPPPQIPQQVPQIAPQQGFGTPPPQVQQPQAPIGTVPQYTPPQVAPQYPGQPMGQVQQPNPVQVAQQAPQLQPMGQVPNPSEAQQQQAPHWSEQMGQQPQQAAWSALPGVVPQQAPQVG